MYNKVTSIHLLQSSPLKHPHVHQCEFVGCLSLMPIYGDFPPKQSGPSTGRDMDISMLKLEGQLGPKKEGEKCKGGESKVAVWPNRQLCFVLSGAISPWPQAGAHPRHQCLPRTY